MHINYKYIIFFLLLGTSIQVYSKNFIEYGEASYYNDKYQGKMTANGEKYDKNKFTAAHKTLPFNTKLKVTNLKNNKSVRVIVNDRGPFIKGRIIDLSHIAATKLNYVKLGVTQVKIEVIHEPKIFLENPLSRFEDNKKTETIAIVKKKLLQSEKNLQAIKHELQKNKKKYNNLEKKFNLLKDRNRNTLAINKKKFNLLKDRNRNTLAINKKENYKIIQVGLFYSNLNAIKKQTKIQEKIKNAYPVIIKKEKKSNNILYRVQIINIKIKNLEKFIKKYKLTNFYVK